MKKNIQILLAALCLFYFNILKSQTTFQTPKLSPPTPEVFSLFKFTDIPVSNTTGIPNISLPVYTIKLKDFEFPISLSYHSSGIRIEEIASNVGLGWTLNSGGMIYNQVNDLDDNEAGITFPGSSGSIPQNRELDPVISGVEQQYNPTNPDYHTALMLTSPDVDTQPDIYYYNCGNLNGKFFYSKDGKINTMPYSPIKIERNGYYSFIITDEKGTKYTFERISETTTTSISIESPAYRMTDVDTKSFTFHITKIETLNNEVINFYYESEKYSYDEPSVFTSRESTYKSSGLFGDLIPGGLPLFVETETKNKVILRGKRLTSITTNSGENIQFIYNNCPRLDLPASTGPDNEVLSGGFALKEIKIMSGQRNDSYVLEHGYFNVPNYTPCAANASFGSDVRLKLISFKKNSEPAYQFQYDESGRLPGRFETSYDHWGYFKSSGGRYSKDYDFGFFDGVTRDPELAMTKLGVLNKITYPTSGYTTFDYELNDYYGIFKSYAQRVDRSIQAHIVGGEELGLPNEAQYLTQPFTIPQNFESTSALIIKDISTGEQTTSNFVNIYITDANNQSNNIIYKIVPESTTPNHLVYRMQNLLPGDYTLHVDGSYSGGGATILWVEKIGQDIEELRNINVGGLRIKSTSNYDNINLTNPSSRQFYEYKRIASPLESSGSIVSPPRYSYLDMKSNPICVNVANTTYLDPGIMTYRSRNSKNYLPLSGLQGYHIMYSDVKVYNDQNKVNGYTHFKYSLAEDDKSYNILRSAPVTSHDFERGDLLEQNTYKYNNGSYLPVKKISNEYYYGFNRNSFFSDASFPNEKHALGLVINKLSGDVGCTTGSWGMPIPPYRSLFEMSYFKLYSVWKYLKKSTESTYDKNGANPITTITNYNYNNPTHAQLSSVEMINSEGETQSTKTLYAQDPEMSGKPFVSDMIAKNMIQVPLDTQTFKGTDKLSEQLTLYDKSTATSNLLLPKEVYSAKFPNTLPSLANVGSLEKKITYNQYDDKGNILQYTLDGGIPVSIIWGYNKTQPIAKIENVAYSSIPTATVTNLQTLSNADVDNCMSGSCTEQLLRNALNTLRGSFSDAYVSTYTYNPFVGVTSITDTKGIPSYYEYDSFGRLKFVKDKDLNVLQKYCYNYKGQQVNCSDNTSSTVIYYKSPAQSGSFTKNNCTSGGTGSSVSYSQAVGVYISTISQADADAQGLAKFNTDGQANANANGICTFYSIARSGSFTKNNCASGGTGSSVSYSQAVGASISTISQADADAKGLAKFNTDGQANANTNGICTFYSVARSGSFTKNNCASGGTGSSVSYSQAAGASTSAISQADADAKGLTKFNTDGQANANTNGICTFYSAALSGSFTKNNCASGGTGSSVSYSQAAGASTSTISQADADAKGLTKFNTDGQSNANANGVCTFYSVARSGSFTKNNCASGGTGSSVSYSQAAGASTSTISQADADAKGLTKFNTDGLANANTNGICTFYSVARSGSFTKNNCASGGIGSSVSYSQAAGASTSTISQADADSKGLTKFNTDGQANANTNGICTFYSAALSGSFTKNNCASGGTGSSVGYNQAVGASTSTISQADADAKGLSKFNADGQANANANGICTFYSAALSGSFTKNNCAAGGSGSSVGYSQAYGVSYSNSSQADADAKGLAKFNADGQANANANGICTFYSPAQSGYFTKNDCVAGGAGSTISFSQAAGAVTSTYSQADADYRGNIKFNQDGQYQVNTTGVCNFRSKAISGSFVKNNCPAGTTPSTVPYYFNDGVIYSTVSQADADNQAQALFNSQGQAYANSNGTCTYYNTVKSGQFTRNNCVAGGTGSTVTYTVNAGTYSSTTSQAAADALAQAAVNNNGQAYANTNGVCVFYNVMINPKFYKTDCPAGTTNPYVYYYVYAGTYQSTISQADADNKAWIEANTYGPAYANETGRCLNPGELEE
ncbi:DUF5977 domain-containing protein [Flavobacterium sp. Root186]|uniref:DUF5977 domain-containing protein n=1 Tax=Flavobacterium sp. Root186 TaxID=1736485 RepID=UPI0006F20E97|nr:DUF5977 domain-containing protein [Flavobacterium sp. Root186]KRB59938.1 hypothetical protein ASD98_02155 [Flavobacterium sp. Root186]